MRTISIILFLMASLCFGEAKAVVWFDGKSPVTVCKQKDMDKVVRTALTMFADDMEAVTGYKAQSASPTKAKIMLYQLDSTPSAVKKRLLHQGIGIQSLALDTDGFAIGVADGKIIVAGSNGRGVAYGLLELSRMAGVSPWIWWNDVVPEKRQRLELDDTFKTVQSASVEYRGIFINDEDWSLRQWSCRTYEPGPKGQIGPKTYRRIFELLLRLRANAIWPAMHPGTTPFFLLPNAKAVADSCGIVIGTSHCEPMLRNNVGEWDEKVRGRFNYITNKKAVQDYWIERLEEVKHSRDNMFTIGMRGIHDGSMEGVKTEKEKFDALQQVIDDQQELLRQHVGSPERLAQVFVPYKEVLELYEKGLKVPDYVTLMWCDDNYGYITRMSKPEEQKRKGGAGVYYHLSYWGRPHDHLWLTTTQPGLIYNEMRQAYDHNVRKIWIANVHDPKVASYDLELFLDLAWDINCVKENRVDNHYHAWLEAQFGQAAAQKLFPAMQTFYRLVGQRRPEFMGWSQVELDRKKYNHGQSPIQNTDFTHEFGDEMMRYLAEYERIGDAVIEAEKLVPQRLLQQNCNAYFAMIKYPVLAAGLMAKKMLYAQKARELASDSILARNAEVKDSILLYSALAEKAANGIISLTNDGYNADKAGKWTYLMDYKPRNLPAFGMPPLPVKPENTGDIAWNAPLPSQTKTQCAAPFAADDVISSDDIACNMPEGARQIAMLGHSMKAVSIPKGKTLSYRFTTGREGDALLRIALIPTQPNDGGDIRFAVSVDGGEEKVFSLKEPFRSERWKQNVLRGQAVRTMPVSMAKGVHTVSIRALDDHIVMDQWMLDFKPLRRSYLFP